MKAEQHDTFSHIHIVMAARVEHPHAHFTMHASTVKTKLVLTNYLATTIA